jgi:uncharacterized protein YjbI with pentapeptide repeats
VRFHASPTLPVSAQVIECGPKLVANPEHLEHLQQGVEVWNAWRAANLFVLPDLIAAYLSGENLSGANLSQTDLTKANLRQADLRRANLNLAKLTEATLSGANLSGADLSFTTLTGATLSGANLSGADLGIATLTGANLSGANLSGADLSRVNLTGANLSGANLSRSNLLGANLGGANLTGADLLEANLNRTDLRLANFSGAILIGANLGGAHLGGANLSRANLSRANLSVALLVKTNLVDATLTDCSIHGISAWGVELSEGTKQQGLIITPEGEPAVTVDDLEVAQFVYLLLHNDKVRGVIDTITSKVVLIVGRFSIPERKTVLNALRDELRKRNYAPVVFDFEKPTSRNTDETITLLARMARFVIADISDAKSVLQELRAIVPDNPSVPVQSIIVAAQDEPGMFDFFEAYPWFLKIYRYSNPAQLLVDLEDRVIGPLETEVAKLRRLS